MHYIFNFLVLMLVTTPLVIVDFNSTTNLRSWFIVDDVVMGGRSDGNFEINEDGHGVFYGTISLENNGGFSSVRSAISVDDVLPTSKVRIRLKGDGKSYQFRVKQDRRAYYSYIYPFHTSGEWEEIIIPLKDMYPSFRGRRLRASNYSHETIEEITFLIGNKKSENFRLLIDKIEIIN